MSERLRVQFLPSLIGMCQVKSLPKRQAAHQKIKRREKEINSLGPLIYITQLGKKKKTGKVNLS